MTANVGAASRRAFSLLELMVAVAVLAIAIIGVTEAVTQGMNSSRNATDRTLGVELAEQRLAEALLDPELEPGSDEGDFGDDYPRYRYTLDVEETDLEGLYRIHVSVSWESGVNEHAVDLETCYAPDVLTEGETAAGGDAESADVESGPAIDSPG